MSRNLVEDLKEQLRVKEMQIETYSKLNDELDDQVKLVVYSTS